MKQPGRTFLLLAVLCTALFIRLPGISWELPGGLHAFSYHPDELPMIGAAAALNPAAGQWNPHFYNYGTLQIYLLYIPVALGGSQGSLDLGFITFLGRLLTVLMAVGTVAACWYAGEKIAGLPGALCASAFIALAPLHVQQSQFVTVDVPATFWVSLALLATLYEREPLAGLFAGLAAAAKYTAGIALVAPLAAILLDRREKPARRGAATCALAAGGFVLGCPGAVVWTRDFLRGLTFELMHSQAGHGLVFKGTGPGWLYHLLHSLLPGLGWPLLLVTALAIVAALMRGAPRERAILIFAAVLFLVLSLAQVRFARYTLPLYPAFAMLIAAWVGRKPPRAVVAGLAAVLVLTSAYSLILESEFVQPDPRTQAALWVDTHVPHGRSIAFPTTPWFYSPPLSPLFGDLTAGTRRKAAESVKDFHLIVLDSEWEVSMLSAKPDYVIISNFEAEDRRRLGDPTYLRFMSALRANYSLRRTFGGDPPVRAFALISRLPHDMQYVSPRIRVYARRDQPGA